ncbi:MAG TPA: tetratricopeptide repeat protein [Kofleriaceae bacterium]|jgi:tetratricopeptide (TPR) repeat protein
MRRWLVAAALVTTACRGNHHDHDVRPAPAPAPKAAPAPIVPKLSLSPDGMEELRGLDQRIAIHKDKPGAELQYLSERATAFGRLEDYQAMVAISADWVAKEPANTDAWLGREKALSTVHDFAGARAALAHVPPDKAAEDTIALDEATGHRDRSLAAREKVAREQPNPITLTMYLAGLALAGRFDEARALIPKAAALVRDNPPTLFAWFYFQWGRVYEQMGDTATARAFYEESHRRMPMIEATAHLAQALIAMHETDAAKRLVTETLAIDPHPSILELGVPLGVTKVDDAKAAWDRYVTALPLAFADHAARFYLTVDPKRALELARENLANRDVPEARSLVVLAALAANDSAAACSVVDPLLDAPQRADRFAAWRALSKCGRGSDAARLAKNLGIGP